MRTRTASSGWDVAPDTRLRSAEDVRSSAFASAQGVAWRIMIAAMVSSDKIRMGERPSPKPLGNVLTRMVSSVRNVQSTPLLVQVSSKVGHIAGDNELGEQHAAHLT